MRFNKNPKGAGLLFLFLTFSLAACLLFSLVSITLMESFLALSFVFWIVLIIQGKEKFAVPGFFWPLLAYAGLSLLACAFSVNPEISFKDARELLLYLIIPIVMTVAAAPAGRSKTTLALLASGFLSTLYSVGYLIWKAAPGERIQGFMGHYMTQAGLLLLFLCAAMSFVFFARDKTRWFWGIAFLLSVFCLALTYTRSAWVGLAVSLSFLVLLYKPKAFILVPVAIGLFFLLSPQPMKRRALSIFSLKNYSNQLRIQYLRAGIRIIKEKPLFGTGPDTVDMVFQDPKYGLSGEARRNVHLHNNLIQIGAERGIPTLLAWLAFIVWAFVSLFPMLKTHDPSVFPYTAAAAAALLALFTAGLFEYNFADSEVAVLFLYLITVPFAVREVRKS
jgi:O-antigen ligase